MAELEGGGRGDGSRGTERLSARVHDEEWTKPGTVLGERFVVERKLGSGGMGYVVLARHLELGEPVAIKLILPARAMSEEARNRLTREARAAARIKSAHVARTFDVVSKGPGAPYLVMEFLHGETLRQLLDGTGPLLIGKAVDIVVQACEPLAEAHRNGTIHRDLKPSNLFLTAIPGRPCFVKVLDFGIAKTTESGAFALTQSRALLASPAYASPEQLRASRDVDERSDVWSLGIVLYECVTGTLPFGGQTLAELSSQILRDPPTQPSQHRSNLPQELVQVILRCLEKEPADRFESVDALVRALKPFAPEAAKECLAYIEDLGDQKPALPAQHGAPSGGSSRERSTLTHASVVFPTARTSPKWVSRLVLASTVIAASLWLAVVFLRENGEPANATRPTGRDRRDAVNASPKAPPARPAVLQRENLEPERKPLEHASPATEPTASVAAKPKARVEPAPQRTQRPPASESSRVQQAEPSSLESLPLNDLIDGRK